MWSEIFPKLVGKLQSSESRPGELKMASVAVILRDGENPSALLIRRAEREGDPWSGQVAFPGGKMQEGDRSARDTAAREAREEVGLDPDGDGHFLGYFRSFRTHTGTMEVVPAVFLLKGPGEVRPNAEVSAYKWVPLRALLTPGAKSVYSLRFVDEDREMPAFKVDDFVIWGLTHRILSSLLDVG